MKSSACKLNKCRGKYSLNHKCTSDIEEMVCRCKCHVKKHLRVLSTVGSIVTGGAAIGGKKTFKFLNRM